MKKLDGKMQTQLWISLCVVFCILLLMFFILPALGILYFWDSGSKPIKLKTDPDRLKPSSAPPKSDTFASVKCYEIVDVDRVKFPDIPDRRMAECHCSYGKKANNVATYHVLLPDDIELEGKKGNYIVITIKADVLEWPDYPVKLSDFKRLEYSLNDQFSPEDTSSLPFCQTEYDRKQYERYGPDK